MKKILTAFVVLSISAIWSGALHRAAQQAQIRAISQAGQLQETTNHLTDPQETAALLRQEVAEKRKQLKAALPPSENAELFALLEGGYSAEHSPAWAALRKQLG